jgi:hypothetical protein
VWERKSFGKLTPVSFGFVDFSGAVPVKCTLGARACPPDNRNASIKRQLTLPPIAIPLRWKLVRATAMRKRLHNVRMIAINTTTPQFGRALP